MALGLQNFGVARDLPIWTVINTPHSHPFELGQWETAMYSRNGSVGEGGLSYVAQPHEGIDEDQPTPTHAHVMVS